MAEPLAPPAAPNPLKRLEIFWSQAIGCPLSAVSGNTDFFANGGDSLSAIYLQTRIEESFGVWLPDHAVIEAPTPAEMADLLAESHENLITSRVEVDGLVLFSGGDPAVPPVFIAVPGDIAAAGWLARHLDGPRGIGLVRLAGFEGGPPAALAAWLDAAANDGARRILAADPVGPWRLIAVCGQARLFLELARKLSERGPVSLLMLDPFYILPSASDDDPDEAVPSPDSTSAAIPAPETLPASLDLTIVVTPNWPHRPLAERFAESATGTVQIRRLPGSVRGHAITAGSIAFVAAEIRVWLASRDMKPPAN